MPRSLEFFCTKLEKMPENAPFSSYLTTKISDIRIQLNRLVPASSPNYIWLEEIFCQIIQHNLLNKEKVDLLNNNENYARLFLNNVINNILNNENYKAKFKDEFKDSCIENTFIEEFSGHLNFIVTGCGGDGGEGQKKVCEKIKSYAEEQCSSSPYLILTGDNVYPTVTSTMSDEELKAYYNLYNDPIFKKVLAAIGNHEVGMIGNKWRGGVGGNVEEAMQRRQHVSKYLQKNHSEKIPSPPYYRVKFCPVGQSTAEVEIFVIDSSLLPNDPQQQDWLRRAYASSTAENKILICHHAINKTIGKRSKKDERSRYHTHENFKDPINHHQVLDITLKNLGIPKNGFKYKLVAHDHSLGGVKNRYSGTTFFTGGGSTSNREKAKHRLPGMFFPPAKNLDASEQAGLVHLEYNSTTKSFSEKIIGMENVLWDSSSTMTDKQETKPKAEELAAVKEIIIQQLESYIKGSIYTRHHIEEANTILKTIKASDDFKTIAATIDTYYNNPRIGIAKFAELIDNAAVLLDDLIAPPAAMRAA